MKKKKNREFSFVKKLDAEKIQKAIAARSKLGSAFHLDPLDRAVLLLTIVATDKTPEAIAREFGISRAAVSYHRRKLKCSISRERRRRDPWLSYKKDGSIAFDFYRSKESF